MSENAASLRPLEEAIAAARAGRRLTRQAQVKWGSRLVTVGGDAPEIGRAHV